MLSLTHCLPMHTQSPFSILHKYKLHTNSTMSCYCQIELYCHCQLAKLCFKQLWNTESLPPLVLPGNSHNCGWFCPHSLRLHSLWGLAHEKFYLAFPLLCANFRCGEGKPGKDTSNAYTTTHIYTTWSTHMYLIIWSLGVFVNVTVTVTAG